MAAEGLGGPRPGAKLGSGKQPGVGLLGGLGSGQQHQGSTVLTPEEGAEQLSWSGGTLFILQWRSNQV